MTSPTPRTREEIDAALRVLEELGLPARMVALEDKVDRLDRRTDRLRSRQQNTRTPTQVRLDRLEEKVRELEEGDEDPPTGTLTTRTTTQEAKR